MTALRVGAPAHAGTGFAWVCNVLLREWLGIEYRIEPSTSFFIAGPAGRITWPDRFFGRAAADWLGAATLPALPWPAWPVFDEALRGRIGESSIALPYAECAAAPVRDEHRLPFDLFGAAFVMLSRYEEAVAGAPTDAHGRFDGHAALVRQAGVAQRPVVDEWTTLLSQTLERVVPGWQAARPLPRLAVSCDVDAPYSPGVKSWPGALRHAAKHLLDERSPRLAAGALANAVVSRLGHHGLETYDTFDWMLGELSRADLLADFYFLATNDPLRIDCCYRLDEPRIAALLRKLVQAGHRIGLHGSYRSHDDAVRLGEEFAALRAAVELAGGRQQAWPARQHYLRWRTPQTGRYLDAVGFADDSTLGYSDMPGFRCGTSRPYSMFDVGTRRALSLVEHPLVMMEVALTSRAYLGLGHGERALAMAVELKRRCARFGGEFTLLWHNSNLVVPEARELYRALLAPIGA